MQLVRRGKVKDVYDEGETLLFKFSNRISVFDKIIPNEIPEKGASLCRTSSYWFGMVNNELHFNTHFIEMPARDQMRVKKYSVLQRKLTPEDSNYLIPLEFVTRYYVAGSLFDRIKSGEIKYADLGFSKHPSYGDKLPDPFFETTTKFEKFDRPVSPSEACQIGGLTPSDLEEIRNEAFRIDEKINARVYSRGLIHADGKKEFAMDTDRKPVLVDTFGTADEDRFWDKERYAEGEQLEISKEMVRQYYRSIGYHSKLYEARAKGLKEPEIPPLPPDMIRAVTELYTGLYEKITGLSW